MNTEIENKRKLGIKALSEYLECSYKIAEEKYKELEVMNVNVVD